MLKDAPLMPIPSTTQTKIKFWDLFKSTFCSTSIRNPLAAIIPNNSKEIPPITGSGIEDLRAANLPQKDKRIAITAAPPITQVEYTRVMARTPMFSPYVVFGVEPTKLEIIV